MQRSGNRNFKLWFGLGFVILATIYLHWTVNNEWFDKPPKPSGDGLCYECIGFSLAHGHGFRENYADAQWLQEFEGRSDYEEFLYHADRRDIPGTSRPPLLPMIISAVYTVFGRGPVAYMTIRALSALCLALAGAMATGLTAQLLANRISSQFAICFGALVTLGLAAINRTLKDYTTDFLTEPLALLLTQLLVVVVVLRLEKICEQDSVGRKVLEGDCKSPATWTWAIVVGLIIGGMILTRSLFVFWVPGLLVLLMISLDDPIEIRFQFVALVSIGILSVCAPWWIHNCLALERFMPLGTQGPIALMGGYCQEAYDDGGNWSHTPEKLLRARLAGSIEFRRAESDTIRELQVVEAAKFEVRQWITDNIMLLPRLAIQRAVTHWNPYWGRSAIWKFLIVLGLMWSTVRGGSARWWLIGLPVLSTIVVMVLYETGGRFLVPLYGLLFTLGGLGISGWWVGRPN